MCEPTHSIVQYPDQDDDGTPTGERIDALLTRPPMMDLPKQREESMAFLAWEWTKKRIGDWFHFSKMGFGHSEAIGTLPIPAHRYLPPDTKYEANWWDRSVRLDGTFSGQHFNKELALDCATKYAHKVSIGNMTLLRQFLKGSMRRSERPWRYLEVFDQMLNQKGREMFNKMRIRLFGNAYNIVETRLDEVIKFMLGFTRKRGWLVPEWADI